MEYYDHLYSSRTTRTKNNNKILKLIKKANILGYKKNVYRPINPSHPFNSQILNPNEISKKKNAHLIMNNTIKDIIMKYNSDKKDKNVQKLKNNNYFYYKFRDEDKNYFLALKAILKKDFDHLPKFLSGNKYQKKKTNLKINISRNNKNYMNKLSPNRSFGHLTTSPDIKNYNTEINNFRKTYGIFQYTNKKEKSRNILKNKYKFENTETKFNLIKNPKTTKKLLYTRKHQLKINDVNIKKQLNFAITNMKSKKLGKISIFGVFEDNGLCGKTISSLVINYLIDYFEKCKEMVLNLEKNNFYSIMHWSFVNAQKYLIKTAKKFNIDLYNSGCMGCILFVPKNNGNVFYCANVGKCKCILYTNRGTDILCFPTNINRISERERIFKIIKDKKHKKLEKDLKKDDIKMVHNQSETNDKNDENNNNNIAVEKKDNDNDEEKEKPNKIDNNNDINPINKINYIKEVVDKNEEEEKIDEGKYINYFKEIGYTRCFGNLSGEGMGLSPDPEITECDIRANKVKFAVLGNTIFWKYLDEKEVRFIVDKYLINNDTVAATKELEELIKQKVGISSKVLIDSSFSIVYFDTIL